MPDRRSRQGLRYPLECILLIGIPAKLAGQDSSRAIAHWAKLRQEELAALFHLTCQTMPPSSTWPELAQVFKVENRFKDGLGQLQEEVRYGVPPLKSAQFVRILDAPKSSYRC